MGWPNNFVQGVYNSNNELIAVQDGAGGEIGLAATYTWATKPLASAYIGAAFISDIGGGTYWVSNGTRWKPLNGRTVIHTKTQSIQSAVINSATFILVEEVSMPADLWKNGDILIITSAFEKLNGTTDTLNPLLHIGTVSGTVGTSTATTGFPPMPTTNVRSSGCQILRRLSSTSYETMNTNVGATGSAFATGGRVITGMPSMDSQWYLQLCLNRTAGAGGTETVVVQTFTVELLSNTNL